MSEETKADTPMETKSTTTTTTSTTKKGGSKTMIIVIVAIILLCCCVSIIGGAVYFYQRARSLAPADIFNSITNNTAPNILNPGTVSDNQGNSVGVSLPAGFPTDVPIVAGSTVTYGIKSADGSFAVNLTNPDKTTQQVVDAYRSGLVDNGWSIQSEGSIFGYVITADKDTREVNLVVLQSKDANGKDVQSTTLSVGPKN